MGRCSASVCLVVGAVAALALAYHFYTPLPEWAGEPWLLRSYIFGFKMAHYASIIVSSVTSMNQLEALRFIVELVYFDASSLNDPAVEVIKDNFEGVPVKIFRPRAARSSSPAVVYIHGGGWMMFSTDSYSRVTNLLAKTSNAIIVSIEYKLSPESPYPKPFDECLRATAYFLHNAEKYGVNPKRIAIAGDSAGGNLAAAVALRLSHEDPNQMTPIRLQVLIYPVLQALDLNTYSYRKYSDSSILPRSVMMSMWLSYMGIADTTLVRELDVNNHTSPLLKKSEFARYIKHENLPADFQSPDFKPLGDDFGNQALSDQLEPLITDPYLAPLMAPDLSHVPPAYIIIAENDVLRDEGLLYAERLQKAGVPVELKYYRRMHHGFCSLAPIDALNFQEGLEAIRALGEYVKNNL